MVGDGVGNHDILPIMILMDGAMGTLLLSHGVGLDSCFESLNLTRPRLISEIHRSYAEAGAKVVIANTFGANRIRLARHGLTKKLETINRLGVRLARQAAPRAKVFASIGPLGPQGRKLNFGQMYKIFREQARALVKEKPDGFIIETMTSLTEAKASTMAVREVFKKMMLTLVAPVKDPRHWGRDAFRALSETLRLAGADVLGTNCGGGPEAGYRFLKALRAVDDGPLCARPAAGLPGRLLGPQAFAQWMMKFKKLGCEWIGGCCGTTPEYIRIISESL